MVESFILGFVEGMSWLIVFFAVRVCQKAFSAGLSVRMD